MIGVVCTSYPRRSDDSAGSFVRTRVRALRQAGHGIEVLAAGDQGETAEDGDPPVRWVEVTSYGVSFNLTPLSVAPIFRKQLDGHPRAWIFTSATLAVGNDFTHYREALGLADAATGRWDSPFDYGKQAVLYAPQGLPEPNSPGFIEAVAKTAFPDR